MLLLNKNEITKSVNLNGMMDQIEEAYRIFGAGEFYMPPRPTVFHNNKTLIYMPCYTEKSLGTKMLTIFPENSKLGLPSIDGLVILNDLETGKTLSIMDGQTVAILTFNDDGEMQSRGFRTEELEQLLFEISLKNK